DCLSTTPSRTAFHTVSLHDALPIYYQFQQHRHLHYAGALRQLRRHSERPGHRGYRYSPLYRKRWFSGSLTAFRTAAAPAEFSARSEEHTSELQSRFDLVCRLLLEKK